MREQTPQPKGLYDPQRSVLGKIVCKALKVDGVVKSPIYCVIGSLQPFDILHVWSRVWKDRQRP